MRTHLEIIKTLGKTSWVCLPRYLVPEIEILKEFDGVVVYDFSDDMQIMSEKYSIPLWDGKSKRGLAQKIDFLDFITSESQAPSLVILRDFNLYRCNDMLILGALMTREIKTIILSDWVMELPAEFGKIDLYAPDIPSVSTIIPIKPQDVSEWIRDKRDESKNMLVLLPDKDTLKQIKSDLGFADQVYAIYEDFASNDRPKIILSCSSVPLDLDVDIILDTGLTFREMYSWVGGRYDTKQVQDILSERIRNNLSRDGIIYRMIQAKEQPKADPGEVYESLIQWISNSTIEMHPYLSLIYSQFLRQIDITIAQGEKDDLAAVLELANRVPVSFKWSFILRRASERFQDKLMQLTLIICLINAYQGDAFLSTSDSILDNGLIEDTAILEQRIRNRNVIIGKLLGRSDLQTLINVWNVVQDIMYYEDGIKYKLEQLIDVCKKNLINREYIQRAISMFNQIDIIYPILDFALDSDRLSPIIVELASDFYPLFELVEPVPINPSSNIFIENLRRDMQIERTGYVSPEYEEISKALGMHPVYGTLYEIDGSNNSLLRSYDQKYIYPMTISTKNSILFAISL